MRRTDQQVGQRWGAWTSSAAFAVSLVFLNSPVFAQAPAGGTTPAAVQPAQDEKFPAELTQLETHQGNPVFTARADGWDKRIRERGWILKEGGQYTLWYTGYDGGKTSLRMLGRAVSSDGIHWKREPDAPLNTTDWIEDMSILKVDGVYRMFCEGKNDVAQAYSSQDGVAWTHDGPLDIRLAGGEPIPPGPRGTPTVWHENGKWHLFYERGDKGVWLATSADRKVWTNVQDEPVLARGPAAYDAHAIALNQVFKLGSKYYGVYHGSATPEWKEWNTNLATSDDLVHWTKYAGNPVLEENKSSGIVVFDGKWPRLYTMHDKVQLHFPKGEAPAFAPKEKPAP